MTRYQYGTSPRKLEPEFLPRKKVKRDLTKEEIKENIKKQAKEKAKQKKAQVAIKKKVVVCIAIIFGMLLVISYRNSLITESLNKVKDLKSDLAVLQKENQQTEVSIESNLNLNKIEQEAQKKLGMQTLTNEQKIYINLPKKDYVESAVQNADKTDTNWFQELLNKLTGNN